MARTKFVAFVVVIALVTNCKKKDGDEDSSGAGDTAQKSGQPGQEYVPCGDYVELCADTQTNISPSCLRTENIYFGEVRSCGIRLTWKPMLEFNNGPADHYKVYRNDEFIGQTTYPIYEDEGAPAGDNSYQISSVLTNSSNEEVESEPSTATRIDTTDCDNTLSKEEFMVQNAEIQPFCDSVQTYWAAPQLPAEEGPRNSPRSVRWSCSRLFSFFSFFHRAIIGHGL